MPPQLTGTIGKPKDSRAKGNGDEAASEFASDQAAQTDSILCVFRGLGGAELEQKIR
jgi:hypothetical protein